MFRTHVVVKLNLKLYSSLLNKEKNLLDEMSFDLRSK